LGQRSFTQLALSELMRIDVPPHARITIVERITETLFYEEERERWLEARNSVRAMAAVTAAGAFVILAYATAGAVGAFSMVMVGAAASAFEIYWDETCFAPQLCRLNTQS
jgi:hypothetical protein